MVATEAFSYIELAKFDHDRIFCEVQEFKDDSSVVAPLEPCEDFQFHNFIKQRRMYKRYISFRYIYHLYQCTQSSVL